MADKTVKPDSVLRKPLCPRGHNKLVVGVYKHYQCKACQRERSRRQPYDPERSKLYRQLYDARTREGPHPAPRLRETRRALGIGFAEFARRVGVSLSWLGKIERGASLPSEDLKRRIVAVVAEEFAKKKRRAA